MAKKWTPSEEKFLLDNYGKVPMAELADKFGVTRKAISAKLDKLRQTHGIDPVGARERAAQKTGKPAIPGSPPPAPGGAIPRPLPKREELRAPQTEVLDTQAPANKIASGMAVKTEKGWHPLYVDKKKIGN
jgi:hypothetical protein